MSTELNLSPRSIAAQQERQAYGCTCMADIPFTDLSVIFSSVAVVSDRLL